jgi:hypothetical protein
MPKRDWIGDLSAMLSDRLGARGPFLGPREAREIISHRVLELGLTINISTVTAGDCITEATLDDLVDTLAGSNAEDDPARTSWPTHAWYRCRWNWLDE